METGSSSATPAKVFFSISLIIFIYDKQLSSFLTDDLQIMIFWSGAIILGLSVVPLVRGLIQLGINIVIDRNLPKEAFTFWETLNRPQWENFLNNVIGDVYLLMGFTIISLKLAFSNFFDQSLSFLSSELISTIILFFCSSFCIIISIRLVRRIQTNRFHIELSQHLLTINKTQGSINPEARDDYVNRNWYLFETSFKKAHYSRFLGEWNPGLKNMAEHVKLGNRENISWFTNLKGYINSLMGTFNRGRMHYHFKLAKFSVVCTHSKTSSGV